MNLESLELAPFLSANELLALCDSTLPFDAIALYIRAFCFHDKGNGEQVNVSTKAMSQLNGYVTNTVTKPLREARRRTLIKHLERVGLIDKPVVKLPNNKPTFSRSYTRLLSDGLTSITAFEYDRLVALSLSYEALCLYIRAIRPSLNIHTFKAIVCFESVNKALTLEPLAGSTEPFKSGSKLVKSALTDLVSVGLITHEKSHNNYVFTCYVSNSFDSKWLKSLSNKP